MKKLLLSAIVILGFSAATFAQSSTTATANALLIVPISIAHNADLNFGTIGASATAGTVTIAPNGTQSSSTGLKIITGAKSAAAFTVTGEIAAGFSITIPTALPYTLTGDGTSPTTMDITAFTISPASGATIGSGGTTSVTVGATLAVNANQKSGTYTNATPFTVTVNYN